VIVALHGRDQPEVEGEDGAMSWAQKAPAQTVELSHAWRWILGL
jgi:hypothetical protein